MNDDVKYERIEQYLAGEMTGEDLIAFEHQLATDDSLRAELDLHRQVAETLKGAAIHEFRGTINEVNDQWQAPKRKKNEGGFSLINLRWGAVAAAAIVILLVAYQIFMPGSTVTNQTLFADNFEPYKMVLTQRSLVPNPETAYLKESISEAIAAYEDEDYAKASSLFQMLEEKSPHTKLTYSFYAAITELALDHPQKAIPVFKKIIEEDDSLLVEQSQWYLGLAYLQSKDVESAKNTLKSIAPNAYKYKEAQKIVKAIQ